MSASAHPVPTGLWSPGEVGDPHAIRGTVGLRYPSSWLDTQGLIPHWWGRHSSGHDVTPYYEDTASGITIYHGDCREVLQTVIADVFVTDPPYGVNLGSTKGTGAGHGLKLAGYANYEDTPENFKHTVVPAIHRALSICVRGAVFANSVGLSLLPRGDAIGGVYTPNGAGRHRWGFHLYHPVLFYGTAPLLGLGGRPDTYVSTARAEPNGHPCPKPIEWLRWLVGLASLPAERILDPFMGSGTTLRAAKDMGRRAVGIEIEERYCEIAAKRLSQGVLFGVEGVA